VICGDQPINWPRDEEICNETQADLRAETQAGTEAKAKAESEADAVANTITGTKAEGANSARGDHRQGEPRFRQLLRSFSWRRR
jgi:hypothetical protein